MVVIGEAESHFLAEFHPEARHEFDTELDRRMDFSETAALRYLAAVTRAIQDIIFWPEAYPVWEDALTWPEWVGKPIPRSHAVRGFGYRVVFIVVADKPIVVAVAATKRKTGYWRERGFDYEAR
ncbi:MAG: hypothetical protein LBB58_05405 [Cellulomonadaceae bacterium]|nr:hypothetical protein [Cellulomonadaceae bacterium]